MKNQHFNHYPHRIGWADIQDMQEWNRIKAQTIAGALGFMAVISALVAFAVLVS